MPRVSFPSENSLYINNKLQTSFWQKIHISIGRKAHDKGDVYNDSRVA